MGPRRTKQSIAWAINHRVSISQASMASQPTSCAFKLLFSKDWSMSTYTGHVVGIADSLREQPVPDLPGEDARALALVVRHLVHHPGGRHAGLGAADGARLDRPGLVIPGGGSLMSWKDNRFFLTFRVSSRRIHWRPGGSWRCRRAWPPGGRAQRSSDGWSQAEGGH